METFEVIRGIGVIFDTRKGYISIQDIIITLSLYIIVYHFVSMSSTRYIMSIGDT
jgi:hypothetical protein